jgi:hypothetical protein
VTKAKLFGWIYTLDANGKAHAIDIKRAIVVVEHAQGSAIVLENGDRFFSGESVAAIHMKITAALR